MRKRLRRLVCGLFGHMLMRRFDRHRLTLACTLCDYETPGWTV